MSDEQPKLIKIKLPTDYVLSNISEDKTERTQIGLKERNAINEASIRFMASKMADDLMKPNYLADMLFMGYKPPTKWQRFKNRLIDYKQRCKDIWTILSGGDIHENCGDY